MKGAYQVVVRNNRVQFTLQINRNITILRGDSATGKTTLIEMVAAFQQEGPESGVSIDSEHPCVVLAGGNWQAQLKLYQDSIVFIDEGSRFVASHDFADAAKKSSNYYVIAVRESLAQLPYSVCEVYGIKNDTSSSRGRRTKKFYSSNKRLFADHSRLADDVLPEAVIVEDLNSGYQFFSALCERLGISCMSAGSKSKIYGAVCGSPYRDILVVADGAAFGPEFEKLDLYAHSVKDKRIRLFLPESFEYLILASGLIKHDELAAIMANPSAFIESREYFSWERFFTSLLTEASRGTYLAYGKSRLNEAYLGQHESDAIVRAMSGKA